jgi:hypothetical protein
MGNGENPARQPFETVQIHGEANKKPNPKRNTVDHLAKTQNETPRTGACTERDGEGEGEAGARTFAGGGEVGATGTQAAAGGVEREEVRGVEAGHDELGLGGDAAEAGDAAPEVDGGHHGLAALRGGHVRRAEERDLGGEERGLAGRARLLRPEGGGGGREQRRQEAGEQEQAAEAPLHGWGLCLSLA